MVGAQVSLNPDKYRTITTFSNSSVLFRVTQIKKKKAQHAFFKKSGDSFSDSGFITL